MEVTEPIYVWRDPANSLHVMSCDPLQWTTSIRCQCRAELKRLTERDPYFVLVLVHQRITYLLYLAYRCVRCQDHCTYRPASPNRMAIHVTLCVSESNHHMPPSHNLNVHVDPSYFTFLKIVRLDDLFHDNDCNRLSCCACTRKLIERGFYRCQRKVNGLHLNCYTEPVGQELPSRLEPYVFEHLEHAWRQCMVGAILPTFDDEPWTFQRVRDDEPDAETVNGSGLSPKTIQDLPSIEITQDGVECNVCLQSLERNTQATQLPCQHVYHASCIRECLKRRNTCPTCRDIIPHSEHV
ncbi:hypothetical protein JTE90_008248 [Oedothorax gibbosus]|uniref:RING-type domain-containing protein n=1 Tax=Oedothorax gibbosus TaxID=931172 RepID=A0AAV6TM25_9ARAC|nr:hypothetical protein JTE90_008248 [Oedothorax gibbosus]